MKRLAFASLRRALLGALLLVLAGTAVRAAESFLWQIGKADNNNAELAFAPDRYAEVPKETLYVVGVSDAKRDWPYIQPGPDDAWAGSRSFIFSILFGLKSVPASGDCRLQFDLIDTHKLNPPAIRVRINGTDFERALPKGAGDESVHGQPAKGKEHKFAIAFPAALLKSGDNEISITTLRGSWLLYDWVGLQTPEGAALAPASARTLVDSVQAGRALVAKGGRELQPVRIKVRHFGGDAQALARIEGAGATPLALTNGAQTFEALVPAVSRETIRKVAVELGGQTLISQTVTQQPVRKLTIYVLPHSHTDIGYTEIQTAIEKKQVNNLVQGIEYARKTAGYPEGARFVWNVEVLWAADLYLNRMSPAQRADFLSAVKGGQVALNGMYLNELTGLCRPEELLRLFRYATELSEKTGVPVDSAMISDVPGYTWGTVTAMAQAGIKYFSVAPNYFDRIGDILVQWENKPFYWVGPDGKSKVLVWIPYMGYAMSHLIHHFSDEFMDKYQSILEKTAYPYDIAYVRWSGHGDNAVPDPAICEFFKEWNTRYAWPKFIVSSTSDAFRAFEQKYGDKLPRVRGDWTPYWEDGAGSSAYETALNRATSDRLVQAEALFAMLNPGGYAAGEFEDAWRNTLLYSEHTWGADCSVSAPESQKTKEQWDIKQSYALNADRESRALLSKALATEAATATAFEVLNTTSWPRTDLVTVPKELATAGERVLDDQNRPVPSQRLSSGELVFVARFVPPFGARRFTIATGAPHAEGEATARGAVLDNGLVRVRIDERTGGIVELTARGLEGNFADTSGGEALNDYLFLPGDNLANLQRNGPVKITVKERGPLVASLLVESEAPGCNKLMREVRLVAGFDYVELLNTVDKKRAATAKAGDWQFAQKGGKESVNFAFPFNLPGGEMQLDIPFAVMRPDADQMPSACKNWFTAGRWADVFGNGRGITWVTLDAPLVEIGAITANMPGSQTNPKVWRMKVERTQKLYSWAMNNHWHTNYRAYQDGPVLFRFILRPHQRRDPAEASRFATGFSQPLLARPAGGRAPGLPIPRLRVEPDDVLVTGFKPSDDGKAYIVRLFGASGEEREARLRWSDPAPREAWLSDLSEKPLQKAGTPIAVPAWGVVTLRVDR